MDDFGERLRRLREHLKLKQSDLARSKDLKERRNFGRYVSKIETGDERNPSLSVIERLAKGCGLALSEFFLRLETNNYAVTSADPTVRDKRTPTPGEVDVHDEWYGPAVSAANATELNRRIQLLEHAIERLNAERAAAIGDRPGSVPSPRRKKSLRSRTRA